MSANGQMYTPEYCSDSPADQPRCRSFELHQSCSVCLGSRGCLGYRRQGGSVLAAVEGWGISVAGSARCYSVCAASAHRERCSG